MKKIILITLCLIALASITFGANLSLKATWTQNTESDMASYKLYRTDGGRALIGTILHPPTFPYLFSVAIPDNSQGTLTFVLTAIDTAGNESADSGVVNYPFDLKSPAAPSGVSITK